MTPVLGGPPRFRRFAGTLASDAVKGWEKTVFRERLQEACFALTEICENMMKLQARDAISYYTISCCIIVYHSLS